MQRGDVDPFCIVLGCPLVQSNRWNNCCQLVANLDLLDIQSRAKNLIEWAATYCVEKAWAPWSRCPLGMFNLGSIWVNVQILVAQCVGVWKLLQSSSANLAIQITYKTKTASLPERTKLGNQKESLATAQKADTNLMFTPSRVRTRILSNQQP